MAVLEAAGSGAAPVLVAAYNHFAVEFLLLLLESIFHLLPFQSSIPGERVISERLQAGRQAASSSGSGQGKSEFQLVPHAARAHLSPKGITFLPGAARSCPQGPTLCSK